MRAAVIDRYGPPEVVRVAEVPTPEPGPREVRVRVDASSVTVADARIRAARFPAGLGLFARLAFGVRAPRRAILGSTFAGVVDAAGPDVVRFQPGDRVCGMAGSRMGTHAELAVVAESTTVPLPADVSTQDAAGMLFGGTTALFFLRDRARVRAGESVLVVGASGAVGTNAVQLARHLGARVTGVTRAANADLVRALGAERIIDYERSPLSALADRFDVVIDTVGILHPSDRRRLLTEGGRLALVAGSLRDLLGVRGQVVGGAAPERTADVTELLALVANGDLVCVTDRTVTLDDIVDAHRRVDSGRKVGNIVLTPAGQSGGDA